MMHADWINPTHRAVPKEAPAQPPSRPSPVVRPDPAGNENRPGEPVRRHPVWPLLVIAFGLAASAAWAGLLLWLVLRW